MTDKAAVRARVKATRAARAEADRERDRAGVRSIVLRYCAQQRLPAGGRIAAYQPLRTEPGSDELLAELTGAGFEVIVPVMLPDRDLDWISWLPDLSARGGTWSPAGERGRLGPNAIADAMLVLVPAFAVDRHGARLGRGGGSYDRALARVAPTTPVAALIFADELLDAVPTDPWDQPVSAAVTPRAWIALTPSGRRNSP